MANTLALESKAHLVYICASDLYSSKYTGTVEEIITNLLNEAIQHSPSVIILDEVDILCLTRTQRTTDSEKRIISTLLNVLDEINANTEHPVFVIGRVLNPKQYHFHRT